MVFNLYISTNNEYYDVMVKTKNETFYCLQPLLTQHCEFFRNYIQSLFNQNKNLYIIELEEESPYFGLLLKAIHSQPVLK